MGGSVGVGFSFGRTGDEGNKNVSSGGITGRGGAVYAGWGEVRIVVFGIP